MIRLRLYKLPKLFLGLQAKACIAMTVIVVITAAAIGGTAFRKVRAQMIEAAAGQAIAAARLVAVASAEKYATHDTAGLVGLCQHLACDQNLLYVAFLDPDGRIVAVAQKPHTLANLVDASGQHLNVQPVEGVRIRHLTGDTCALEACVPIPTPDPRHPTPDPRHPTPDLPPPRFCWPPTSAHCRPAWRRWPGEASN
jgi:hypothetical protein